MALTPNIMMAAEGLLANTALRQAPLDTASYLHQIIVKDYLDTGSKYESLSTNGGWDTPPDIAPAVSDAFRHALDDSAPYISNATPGGQGITTTYYTTLFNQHVANLFTSNQQYVQYALIASGHIATANKYVNSAVSGQALAAQTFTSSDALMTGNISSVSTSVQAWGAELSATGILFDFGKLDNTGTPQALIEALINAHTLKSIAEELELQGINTVQIQKVIVDDPELILKPLTQKRCYDAFLTITGDKLIELLESMRITTTGITTLADLLDLRIVFPGTYSTLTTPNNGPLENIYSGTNISSFVAAFTPASTAYMPDDLAKANYAFSISLGQIKGILESTPAKIGTIASSIEGNDGLASTGGLSTALPAATSASMIAEMGGGTGPDGTFYLSDLVGAPAGLPHNTNIAIMNGHFGTIQQAGGYDDIAEVLEVMRDVMTSVYSVDSGNDDGSYTIVIPNPLPGEGTYANRDAALYALIDELNLAVAAYIVAYPTEHAIMSKAFSDNLNGVIAGIQQLWEAEVKFKLTYVDGYETGKDSENGLAGNKKTTLSFAESLPQFGKKTDLGNMAEILEALAASNLGGDAVVAGMREGRNSDKLAEAGVTADNQLSDQPSSTAPGNIS